MLAGNSGSKSKNDEIFLMLIDQHMMIKNLLSLKSLISAVEAGGVRKNRCMWGRWKSRGGWTPGGARLPCSRPLHRVGLPHSQVPLEGGRQGGCHED